MNLPASLEGLERVIYEVDEDDDVTLSWEIDPSLEELDPELASLVRKAGGGARVVRFATALVDDDDQRLLAATWDPGDDDARLLRVTIWHDDDPSVRPSHPGTVRAWLARVTAEPYVEDEGWRDDSLWPEELARFETVREYLAADDVELRRLGIADLKGLVSEGSVDAAHRALIATARLALRDVDPQVRARALDALEAVPPTEAIDAMLATGLADPDPAVRATAQGVATWFDATNEVSPLRRLEPEAVTAAKSVDYYKADAHVAGLAAIPDTPALAQLLVLQGRGSAIIHTAGDAARVALWTRFPMATWAQLRTGHPGGGTLVAMRTPVPLDPILAARLVEAIASPDERLHKALLTVVWIRADAGLAIPRAIVDALRAVVEDEARPVPGTTLLDAWVHVSGLEAAGRAMSRCLDSSDPHRRAFAAALAGREPTANVSHRRALLERAAYDPEEVVRTCAIRSLRALEAAGQDARWIAALLAAAT